ncbi:hypothetical protein [Phenylobacterium sp.]|jgi:hypothetical protein|uniref:hypothetical protein n=1 Tax=Phenylobacterium sp. TaxID=1871053 RepID=UPI002F3FA4A9
MIGGPIIRHLDEFPENEVVRIEYEDGRSSSILERFLTILPNFVSFYNRWDPGMMSLKHGHRGDHVVFVLEGEVTIGDQLCRKGSHIFLMHGDRFGPWIAGPQGCELLGIIAGEGGAFWSDQDMTDYRDLLARHGAKQIAVPRLQNVAAWKVRRDSLPGPDPEGGKG